MEIIGEILLEAYMELMLLIVPEKNIAKHHRKIATCIAAVEIVALLALTVWGLVLIGDCQNMWGWGLLGVVVLISLGQVIAGIVLYKRNHE